jgi:uncharacterized membrane protein YhaH (DUF805 family)
MTQAATFGRRGATAPPPVRSGQLRGPARPAPSAPRAAPAPQATPKSGERTLLGYFLWLLLGFSGRLDRRTYRYARIVSNVTYVVTFSALSAQTHEFMSNVGMELLLLSLMFGISCFMIWTTLAMQVKRRHDRDKGWPWLLVGFIPIVGPIWVLVETCWLDGTPGYNRFDDPSKVAAATFA